MKNIKIIDEGWEFLLLISPPEIIYNEVSNIKKNFYNKYKAVSALYGKPHITLANFIAPLERQDDVIHALHEIARKFPHIRIILKNFKSFSSHTIYIDVINRSGIQQLVQKIAKRSKKIMSPYEDFPAKIVSASHMTIARQLQYEQFENSRMEYSGKEFYREFVADKMLLLKRPLKEEKYQLAQCFYFNNTTVLDAPIQGNLFW